MQIGSEFQCEIEKTAFGGDGLTRLDGEVVFIPGALPGEKVIARITSEKKNFSRAEIVRIGVSSPERIEPACPYFGRCPGCRYQHTTVANETALKNQQFADMLAVAKIETVPAPPVQPEPESGYRNKIVLHVHKVGSRTYLGYVMGDNTTVTDIEACPLARPEINAELARLRADRSFLHTLHEGMDVTLRYTEADGVKFWRNQPVRNATWLREETPFGRLSVPCGSFFQVNPAGMAALVAEFQQLLDELRPEQVIDLYAGAGLFACAAAARGVGRILAVESDEAAAAAARYNLRNFGVSEPEVIAGDAAEAFAHPGATAAGRTLLTVDPPRNGIAFKAMAAITAAGPEFLVYISCNPTTWIRDAGRLSKGGYQLRNIRMINMFPRTEHFELFSFWARG